MIRWLVNKIIDAAKSRPFSGGHIYNHLDDTLYMERFALFESKLLTIRVHRIVRPDRDRHLHDHPWDWMTIILRGGYLEMVPTSRTPMFEPGSSEESSRIVPRVAGDMCLRRATDRHRIAHVSPNTWTLFIHLWSFNWWGFVTPAGKIPWRKYLGASETGQ